MVNLKFVVQHEYYHDIEERFKIVTIQMERDVADKKIHRHKRRSSSAGVGGRLC